MCNVKAKVIPIIIGATGTISQSLRQYLSNTPGKLENKRLQNNCHAGHCTHTAESTNVKVQNIFPGEITLHVAQIVKTNSRNTVYPRNIVCFRYMIVNTLHKSDNRGYNNKCKDVHGHQFS